MRFRGEIKDARRRMKEHRSRIQHSQPSFVAAFRDHAKIRDLLFTSPSRWGEVSRPLSARNLISPSVRSTPCAPSHTARALYYPPWIFIATWPSFQFCEKRQNSRGRQNSNGRRNNKLVCVYAWGKDGEIREAWSNSFLT